MSVTTVLGARNNIEKKPQNIEDAREIALEMV